MDTMCGESVCFAFAIYILCTEIYQTFACLLCTVKGFMVKKQ